MSRRSRPLVASALLLSLVASACSSDSNEVANESQPCPSELVIQTDWWPELEHGGTYNLIGSDGVASADDLSYSGSIREEYSVGGIEKVEIRAGGDAIGGAPALSEMAAKDEIYLAYVNASDVIATSPTIEAIGVAGTLEKNPLMLQWDAEQYDFSDISTLAESELPVLHFDGDAYIEWLIGEGIIAQSQSDPSYTGAPDRWLTSNGQVIQTGFVTNEVYKYESDMLGWGKPVDYVLVHDLGFEDYPAMYTVQQEELEEKSRCLEVLVPVLQQAWVDYWADPTPTTNELVEIAETYDTFWEISESLNDVGIAIAEINGISSNGPDSTYGNFDLDRTAELIEVAAPIFRNRGIDVAEEIAPSDIVTNAFIDPSIGRPE